MRYSREVKSQVKKDLHVEFGMEWGLTEPLINDNVTVVDHTCANNDKTREKARQLKKENWRDRE